MNYLKTIKAAKQAQAEGLSRKNAMAICYLIKELATKMYDWDLLHEHYTQFNAIMTLADNLHYMYLRGR